MKQKFKAHGHFKTWFDGNLLMTEVTGPWNKELVDDWANDAYLQVQASGGGPVAAVSIIRQSILCTPEALTALRAAVRYAARHLGCIGTVIVAEASVEGRALLEPTYRSIYADVTPHWFCSDVDSGRQWALALLAQQGY